MKLMPRSRLTGAAVALSTIVITSPAKADFIDFLFGPRELEPIVVSDVTDAGRMQRQPTKEHPIYYYAISAGYRDFGGIIAGDKPMPRALMNETVMKVLAKQGYLPAGKAHRADIFVTWTWGTLYVYRTPGMDVGFTVQVNEQYMRWFLGGAKLGVTYDPSDRFRVDGNRRLWASATLGNPFPDYSLPPGLEVYSGPAQTLIDTARQNLYVAVVAAYKVDLDASRHGQLLWMTRISAPARGFWMPDALPPMVAIAGPYFGKDTPKPVWIMASDKFKPDIRIGDPRVLEYFEKNDQSVTNVGASK